MKTKKKKTTKKKKPVNPMVISGADLKTLELIGNHTVVKKDDKIIEEQIEMGSGRIIKEWPKEVYLVDKMFCCVKIEKDSLPPVTRKGKTSYREIAKYKAVVSSGSL